MFTRRVIMNIKPGAAAEVGRIVEGEVLPLLRRQKGMRRDDTFLDPEGQLLSYEHARYETHP